MRKTIVFTAALIVASVNAQAADRYVADKTTRAECGACHMAYPPILLPAASWDAIMGDLSNHFGEDASLDEATTVAIADWLRANAAENWDTKAAAWFNTSDGSDPLRITASRRWKLIHGSIPDAVFKRNTIGSRANCSSCHGDAQAGLFAPQHTFIPEARRDPS